jgi:signal peptidase II
VTEDLQPPESSSLPKPPESGKVRGLWLWFIGCAAVALVADQVTKEVMLHLLDPANPIPIVPGCFELLLVFNPGAAFSMFEGARWMFIGVSALALVFLPYYLRGLMRQGERSRGYPIGLGMILGGAIGNAIDRLFRPEGLVVDFFHAFWGDKHFPVFNVADSAISVGLAVLMLTMVLRPAAAGQARLVEGPAESEGERDVAGSV